MPLNLGSSAVSLYLGNQAVNAYLGGTLVTPPAGPFTLYFNGAVDGDWATLGNWWLDASHTVAATALPAAADSVIVTEQIFTNSGSEPTVVNFTIGGDAGMETNITVTGTATFNDNALLAATVTGNATFNDSAQNAGGTVTGNANFYGTSAHAGESIGGDATFNGSSTMSGDVTGTATFYDSAVYYSGSAGAFVPDPPPSV